jgi:glycosyltransferase involved in cell wall biosynthesis
VRHETKKKFLNDGNETEYFQKRINLEKEIVRNSSYIISLAATEKENLEKLYNCISSKIKVVKGGVNLKHWPHIDKKKARNTVSLDQKSFVVLFVGRLEWRKGIGTLITAANLLKNEIENLKVVIVGGKIFGPNANAADYKEYKRLQQKAEQEGVKSLISFCGNVDHGRLPVYYRSANAFVIPSYYEPFGLVALEGMASCVPVIASCVDGLAATIKDGVTGLFFEARNPLSLKNKIMEIYNSKETADKLAQNAYLEITKNYSWHTIAKKIAETYKSLTDKPLTTSQNKHENRPTVSA